jgi:hypothetical protein
MAGFDVVSRRARAKFEGKQLLNEAALSNTSRGKQQGDLHKEACGRHDGAKPEHRVP